MVGENVKGYKIFRGGWRDIGSRIRNAGRDRRRDRIGWGGRGIG